MKYLLVALALFTAINAAPSTSGYYNAKKEYSFGFTYEYALNFNNVIQVPFNTTTIDLGTMNLCVQTFGTQAVGPYSCALNYMYDSANDKFHYLTGDCDANVAHLHTDMLIKSMAYDSSKDSVSIEFTSHGPTAATYELTKGDDPIVKCDPPTDKAPKEYCPAKRFMSIFE